MNSLNNYKMYYHVSLISLENRTLSAPLKALYTYSPHLVFSDVLPK